MAFWRPGTVQPGSKRVDPSARSRLLGVKIPDVLAEAGEDTTISIGAVNPDAARLPIQQQRLRLPIYSLRREILYAVETFSTLVIVGETGSGKTTQLPQFLHEAGWTDGGRVVVCTQPRRVAAITVAMRVAEEMGTALGDQVGYAVRFDDKWDRDRTRIKYTTDGLLLRELLLDPMLSNISVVMVDEAHERSVQTDILLAVLKKIQRRRPDLKIIISSATVDAEVFQRYFHHPPALPASILSVHGRQFPVDIMHLEKPAVDYLQAALETIIEVHMKEKSGDMLVFLTGQDDIDMLSRLLHEQSEHMSREALRVRILTLHSSLPQHAQMAVFEPAPYGVRKIILATNIAETSVTIDNVTHVIDCGFVKARMFDVSSASETLHVVPISQAAANQRAGRAGRVREGKCLRLYPESAFRALPPHTVPELQRSNLVSVILHLKALGVDDVVHFDFLAPPPVEHLVHALELLHALKMVDNGGRLTSPLGVAVSEFPLDPLLAKMCFSASEFNCGEEILSLATMLSLPPCFLQVRELLHKVDQARRNFAVLEGDHITLINVYNVFINSPKSERASLCNQYFLNGQVMNKAVAVRRQLVKFFKRFKIETNSCGEDITQILQCVTAGFFPHAAQLQPDGTYKSVRGNFRFSLHPSSALNAKPPSWIVYHEIVTTTQPYARTACQIEASWLLKLAPDFFSVKKAV